MKRKFAIWLSWKNYSEYYSRNLAATIADQYETTITYKPLDWSQFDVVMSYYAGPNRVFEGCDPGKVVRQVHEPHEYQWTGDAGTIIAVSRYLLNKAGPRLRERTVHIPHGVALSDFYPQPWPQINPITMSTLHKGGIIVGWCGQYKAKYKRFDELKAEVAKVPGVIFYPQRSHTGRGGVVVGMPTKEMPAYYRQIHVYASASVSEGFGLPVLEASACGRPVVSFNVGVVPELQETGAHIFTVENWDEMRAVLGKLTLADCMRIGGRNAVVIAQHWGWDKVRERWLEVLGEAG